MLNESQTVGQLELEDEDKLDVFVCRFRPLASVPLLGGADLHKVARFAKWCDFTKCESGMVPTGQAETRA